LTKTRPITLPDFRWMWFPPAAAETVDAVDLLLEVAEPVVGKIA
jgi:hypothetical protein